MAERSKNRSVVRILFLLIFIGFSGFIIFNDYGLIKYMGLKSEINALQREINDTEKKIHELDNQIDSLKTSLNEIEKIARERYHMMYKNEKAFKIEEN
ncbi:MAG: hypothetical protein A2V66_01030 [Ignavibacteria bacterium RBG_13_36_8]|nr:MAG: hypothetical protein A2V66_01030 [Ignavibacteria bacterium RBG_13_36_8]